MFWILFLGNTVLTNARPFQLLSRMMRNGKSWNTRHVLERSFNIAAFYGEKGWNWTQYSWLLGTGVFLSACLRSHALCYANMFEICSDSFVGPRATVQWNLVWCTASHPHYESNIRYRSTSKLYRLRIAAPPSYS